MIKKIITLKTPNKENVEVEIIDKTERKRLLKSSDIQYFDELPSMTGAMNLYKNSNGSFLFLYTIDDYALMFENKESLDKIYKHSDFGFPSIIFANKKYYYSYDLKSNKIIEMISNNFILKTLKGQEYMLPEGNKLKTVYSKVYFFKKKLYNYGFSKI